MTHVTHDEETEFTASYLETMIWSSLENGSTTFDIEDARQFLSQNINTLRSLGVPMAQHGHDFALTRNHHGAGFWDRGYGQVGEYLTRAVRVV